MLLGKTQTTLKRVFRILLTTINHKKQPFKWSFNVQHNLNQRLHTLKALADAGIPAADKAYREEFAKRNSAEIVEHHVNENAPEPEFIDLSGEVPLQFS